VVSRVVGLMRMPVYICGLKEVLVWFGVWVGGLAAGSSLLAAQIHAAGDLRCGSRRVSRFDLRAQAYELCMCRETATQ
jgi:hypothetical protein